MSRVIGLYNIKENLWDKLVYVHTLSGGEACINGSQAKIYLHRAGEPFRCDMDYAIVLPKGTKVHSRRFFAVNSGECLFDVSDDASVFVKTPGFVSISSRFDFWRYINTAVLTVSDKCSRGEREDTAGPTLSDLAETIGAVVNLRATVPDERGSISEIIKKWCDEENLNLILTTGGTGLSKRDITPEALADIQDKQVPGFGETMRARTMLYTPRSFLTRSLAVVRKDTLIIAFPGSETAVKQCFEAVMPAVRHGVETLCGWDSECGHHHK